MVHEDAGCCISNPSIMRVSQTLWTSAVYRHQTPSWLPALHAAVACLADGGQICNSCGYGVHLYLWNLTPIEQLTGNWPGLTSSSPLYLPVELGDTFCEGTSPAHLSALTNQRSAQPGPGQSEGEARGEGHPWAWAGTHQTPPSARAGAGQARICGHQVQLVWVPGPGSSAACD